MKLTRILVALSLMMMVLGCSLFRFSINGNEVPFYKKKQDTFYEFKVPKPEKQPMYENTTTISFKNEGRMKMFFEILTDYMKSNKWNNNESSYSYIRDYVKDIPTTKFAVRFSYRELSEKMTVNAPDDSISISFTANALAKNDEFYKTAKEVDNNLVSNLKDYIENYQLYAQKKGFGFASSDERTAQTADEKLVYGKFGTKGLLALDLIDGVNTIDNIMNKSGMNKQEITDLFKFLIENDFVEM